MARTLVTNLISVGVFVVIYVAFFSLFQLFEGAGRRDTQIGWSKYLMPPTTQGLQAVYVNFSDPRLKGKPFVCTSRPCKALSTLLNETMDFSVNPCDDFYEFTCGGFKKKHTKTSIIKEALIKRELQFHAFVTDNKPKDTLQTYLHNAYEKFKKNIGDMKSGDRPFMGTIPSLDLLFTKFPLEDADTNSYETYLKSLLLNSLFYDIMGAVQYQQYHWKGICEFAELQMISNFAFYKKIASELVKESFANSRTKTIDENVLREIQADVLEIGHIICSQTTAIAYKEVPELDKLKLFPKTIMMPERIAALFIDFKKNARKLLHYRYNMMLLKYLPLFGDKYKKMYVKELGIDEAKLHLPIEELMILRFLEHSDSVYTAGFQERYAGLENHYTFESISILVEQFDAGFEKMLRQNSWMEMNTVDKILNYKRSVFRLTEQIHSKDGYHYKNYIEKVNRLGDALLVKSDFGAMGDDGMMVIKRLTISPPFFLPGYPAEAIFGLIGSTYLRELTRALVNEYIVSDLSAAVIDEKLKCFGDRYENTSFGDDSMNNNTIFNTFIDARQLSYDNAGIRTAFMTYLDREGKSKRSRYRQLPGLDLSSHQVFFVMAALPFCETDDAHELYKNDAAIKQSDYVNEMMKNVGEFGQVFNCPITAKMRTKTTCDIWMPVRPHKKTSIDGRFNVRL